MMWMVALFWGTTMSWRRNELGGRMPRPARCLVFVVLVFLPLLDSRTVAATHPEETLIPGSFLYTCSPNTPEEIPPCNARYMSEVYTRPALPQPAQVVKSERHGELFPIILTAQKKSVNFFQDHYLHVIPKLQLSSSVSLPERFNPNMTEVWTFNGAVPGPTLRARVGDILDIQLRNMLPVATGLYFNGIFILWMEDLYGAGKRNVDAPHQVAMGLYGTLIVSDADDVFPATQQRQDPGDGDVVVIGDALLNTTSWQIIETWDRSELTATEQYNGRIGNVLTVNGRSVSAGYEMGLMAGGEQRLHLFHSGSGSPWNVTLPGLNFWVVSQWLGTDGLTGNFSNVNRNSFILPAGSSATLLFHIHESWAGRQFQVLVQDATPLSERRRPLKHRRGTKDTSSTDTLLHHDPVVAETWIPIEDSRDVKLVDRLLIPSLDGVIHSRGFEDSLDFQPVSLGANGSERLAEVSPCHHSDGANTITCTAMAWGFQTNADRRVSGVSITLYGIPTDYLIGSNRVPDGGALMATSRDMPPLASVNVSCHGETPVQLKSAQLTWFLQQNIAMQDHGRDSLTWLRGDLTYADASQTLYVTTRLGDIIPPPTLRLVYRARDYVPRRLDTRSVRDPAVRAIKNRRLNQILRELRNEQEILRQELQQRYDHLRAQQRAMRGTGGTAMRSGVAAPHHTPSFQRIASDVMEQYHTQQQHQREIEQKIAGLMASDLPPRYQQQVVEELQEQLRKQYLQQDMLQQHLKSLLEALKHPDEADRGGMSVVAFREEKALYLSLYKEYNDIISQMRHVKAAAAQLNSFENQSGGQGGSPTAPPDDAIFHLEPISEVSDPYAMRITTPQTLLRLTIHQGDGLMMSDARPTLLRSKRRLAKELTWTNNNTIALSTPNHNVCVVRLVLGVSLDADLHGHIPMWITSSVQQSQPSEAGDLVVWKIVNPTPLTHTLYFHRTLLEVFHVMCHPKTMDNNNTQVVGDQNTNNGNLIGMTIPSATPWDPDASCEMLAVSRVPKVYGSSRTTRRLPIRIRSSNREHVANGLHTQIHFNIVTVSEHNATVVHRGGLDFMDADAYTNQLWDNNGATRHVKLAAAAAGCVAFLGLAVYLRRPTTRKFDDDDTDNQYVSQPCETTPLTMTAHHHPFHSSLGLTPTSEVRFDARGVAPLPSHAMAQTTPCDTPESYLESPDKYQTTTSLKQRNGPASSSGVPSSDTLHSAVAATVAAPSVASRSPFPSTNLRHVE